MTSSWTSGSSTWRISTQPRFCGLVIWDLKMQNYWNISKPERFGSSNRIIIPLGLSLMSSSTSLSSPSRFTPEFNEAMLAFVAVAILLSGVVIWSSHLSGVEKTDFSLTYVAARIVHRGQGSLLYNVELQKKTRDSLFIHPSPLFFEHPPLEALLLSPLAALSFRSAYAVWGLLNAAVWLFLIIFLRGYLPWPHELLAYISLWLIFAPLAVALYQGQSSFILLALFAAAFVLLKKKRELSTGLALGFGLIKFQFVLPFVLVFVLLRKWRF